MQIYDHLDKLNIEGETALTIGKFDGLHLGHRELLKAVSGMKEKGLLSVVLMLVPEEGRGFLLTEKETESLLSAAGIQVFLRIPLTKQLMSLSPECFFKEILLDKLHVRFLACGSDFRFGCRRSGDTKTLKMLSGKYGTGLSVFEKVRVGPEEVSSTLIRKLLLCSDFPKVNTLLGYDYGISGEVVHGRALARKLGFPTLNIVPPEEKLLPEKGVYYCRVRISDGTFDALVNLGVKPTVTEDNLLLLEAYLLDFSGEVYGKEAEVRFLKFLRPEKKFEDLRALEAQIDEDLQKIRKLRDCEQSVNSEKKY